MFTSSRRRTFVHIALVALALAALTAAVYANNSWGGYHWARTNNPFTLKLGDNVTSTWDPILITTSSDWTASSVLNTTIVAGAARPKNCRPTSGRVEVCNSSYGNNGWLGLAQIWITGGTHIVQGTTKVNDYYHNKSPYNTTPWRNLVMCQEVGHTLGLDHQDENFDNPNLNPGTCMDYTSDPSTNQHPNQHDYDMLQTIYAHLDSTNTASMSVNQAAAAMPPAMRDLELDGPGQWGRLVAGSRERGHSTYELDFGGGRKVITHVFWARERGPEHHE